MLCVMRMRWLIQFENLPRLLRTRPHGQIAFPCLPPNNPPRVQYGTLQTAHKDLTSHHFDPATQFGKHFICPWRHTWIELSFITLGAFPLTRRHDVTAWHGCVTGYDGAALCKRRPDSGGGYEG
ncbi:hypothetical protein BaRGS_00004497 [Batillaria attramentaria]|uniref:Uncharacterized protein n=1 Tax=Batillaria attramentaria TaxID=370345 RepID=A0ABD0LYK7_9CAEN